jgi:hypothetical protein
MLRLTTHNRLRISNRLAFFAAVMLVISALAGAGSLQQTGLNGAAQIAGIQSGRTDQAVTKSTDASAAQGNTGFKMSLFLFRGN